MLQHPNTPGNVLPMSLIRQEAWRHSWHSPPILGGDWEIPPQDFEAWGGTSPPRFRGLGGDSPQNFEGGQNSRCQNFGGEHFLRRRRKFLGGDTPFPPHFWRKMGRNGGGDTPKFPPPIRDGGEQCSPPSGEPMGGGNRLLPPIWRDPGGESKSAPPHRYGGGECQLCAIYGP